MTTEIEYYIFDKIEATEGVTIGYLNGKSIEIFYLSADDTEEELVDKGFAKCDAPDWHETMVFSLSDL
jgi:hypothetical protein